MKIKTSELTDAALDWAVGLALDQATFDTLRNPTFQPSTDWSQGGPIGEREGIGCLPPDGHRGGHFIAFVYRPSQHNLTLDDAMQHRMTGPTELVAKMRCFVVSRLSDVVDVPDELCV